MRLRRGLALAAVAAAAAGVVFARAGRPRYVPQLDAPLWRGTDVEHPTGVTVAGTYVADQPVSESLAGAILGLAFATDETTARYWLAMCARRGADQDTLRDLWAEWQRQQQTNVHHLYTDRDPED